MRVSAVTAKDELRRILDSPLLAKGMVNVLSFEALAAHMGDRWALRREHVWEHVERTLRRRLEPRGVFVRVGDSEVVLAVAAASAFEAQTQSVECLREVMNFFLGREAEADLVVRRLHGIGPEGLVTSPVDLNALPDPGDIAPVAGPSAASPTGEAMPVLAQVPAPAAAAEPWAPPLTGRRYPSPLVSRAGKVVEMAVEVVPIWRLSTGLVSSFHLQKVVDPEALVGDYEKDAADMAVFACMCALLEESEGKAGPFGLHVPVNFATLASQPARLRLLHMCRAQHDLMRDVVVFELEGVDSGAPEGRLHEVVGLIKPFCKAVLVRADHNAPALSALKAAGARGLTFDLVLERPRPGTDKVLHRVMRAAQDFKNLVLHGLEPAHVGDPRLVRAGLSHVSARQAEAAKAT